MQLHHNSELSEKSSTKMGANFHTPLNESMNQSAHLGFLPNNSVLDPDLFFMSMNPSAMHLNHNNAALE